MRKLLSLLTLILALPMVMAAEVFVTERMVVKLGAQVKNAVQPDVYYVISGVDQAGVEHYLYDNGGQVKGTSTFDAQSDATSSYVWTLTASGNQWIIKNVGTGAVMNLGGSNGSAIKTAATEQKNAIHFGNNGFMTILNDNGQAIDMTANGVNPTTWVGTTTPTGSRQLKIYDVEEWTVEEHRSLSLIPAPKSAVVGEGEYVLSGNLTMSVGDFADNDVKYEVVADMARFATTLNKATGVSCEAVNGAADIVITENQSLAM